MKQRSAFTLVELLTTLTVGSSVMLLAIGLVHQSMSASKLTKVRWEHDQSLARLAQQFRSDVHLASELIASASDSLSLKLPDDSKVSYRCEASNVTWEKTGPNAETARETFRFDSDCVATIASEGSPLRLILQLERRLDSTEFSPPVDLRVVASLGRWRQLEQGGGE